HRDSSFPVRIHILKQRVEESVANVRGKIQVFSRLLFLSLFHCAYRDLSGSSVNPAFAVLLERWSFLHNLIAYQTKRAVLSEFGDLIVDRSVFKTELHVADNETGIFVFHNLLQFSIGDDLAIRIAEN